ncbi:hypothetical protein PL371_00315 [Tenacibaculum maritimum]|nr:hypothetical protein [Tenacibaculum maritimum]MDB0610339.1 hypothetical protein [Tenacibaculum maritimum]
MNTFGIGGSTIEAELNAITPTAHLVEPIQKRRVSSQNKQGLLNDESSK